MTAEEYEIEITELLERQRLDSIKRNIDKKRQEYLKSMIKSDNKKTKRALNKEMARAGSRAAIKKSIDNVSKIEKAKTIESAKNIISEHLNYTEKTFKFTPYSLVALFRKALMYSKPEKYLILEDYPAYASGAVTSIKNNGGTKKFKTYRNCIEFFAIELECTPKKKDPIACVKNKFWENAAHLNPIDSTARKVASESWERKSIENGGYTDEVVNALDKY